MLARGQMVKDLSIVKDEHVFVVACPVKGMEWRERADLWPKLPELPKTE